ncbi:MAG: hypothetical protein ACM3KM_03135 [Acidobacteriaceae bacterium]
MITKPDKKNLQSGQIIIFGMIFSLIVLMMISALIEYAGIQTRSHRTAILNIQALNLAEAGIERTIWKMNNQIGYAGESNTAFGPGTYNITISNLSSNSKLIKSEAFIPNAANPKTKRTVQVTVVIGTTNLGFNYGVQVGAGGLEMSGSSAVLGNVYSNGDIIGQNPASIQGTAIAAGPTGKISNMTVLGSSYSHSIENSTVAGRADHFTMTRTDVAGDASVSQMVGPCTVGGSAAFDTNSGCSISGSQFTPNDSIPPDPTPIPLPISYDQIDTWETDAAAGGTIGTLSYSSGTRTLGPKKITGDLVLTNTAELVVQGTIWVTGRIILNNSAVVRLDPNYGGLSGLLIAGTRGNTSDGYIEVTNSVRILGSGAEGSYMMLLSEHAGTSNIAIKTSNSGTAAILYAGDGLIEVNNFAALKEITGYKLRLNNNVSISYESGLANTLFTSGPGGGWEMLDRSWQLIK